MIIAAGAPSDGLGRDGADVDLLVVGAGDFVSLAQVHRRGDAVQIPLGRAEQAFPQRVGVGRLLHAGRAVVAQASVPLRVVLLVWA